MAMTLEEAKRLTNKKLAEQRKGYLAENAYRQSPEGIKKGKENLVSMLEYTPAAIPIEGYRAYDNIKKGNYLDAAIDAGVGIGMGVAPLAVKPIAKLGSKVYKSLKNIFSGPLSPQYNSEGGFIPTKKNLKEFLKQQGQAQFNRLMKRLNEIYGDAHTLFTGQGGDIPEEFIKNNMGVYTKPKVSLSGRAPTADEYAKIQGEGKRLIAIPYSPNANFNKFEETIISNPTMPTHGGHEVRIGPLALQKTKKDIIGGKPISFPAGIASNPTLVNQLDNLSPDQLKNWASKNVFSKGGTVYAADGINPKKIFKQKAKEIINRLLGNKKVSKKEREELEELAAFREEMKIEYPDSDVTFHRSLSPNLKISGAKDDPNAFKYKTINVPNKAGFNQGQGIFTFGLEDTPKFKRFGPHIYGGVYPKSTRVFPGRMDTESNLNEIFIKENDLEDLIKVK